MEKLVVLYPPQPDPEAFKSYYVATHVPLARKLPGLKGLRYSFDIHPMGGEPSFFCVFEAEFANEEAFGAAMASAEGQAVTADLPNFAQVPPTVLRYTVEQDA